MVKELIRMVKQKKGFLALWGILLVGILAMSSDVLAIEPHPPSTCSAVCDFDGSYSYPAFSEYDSNQLAQCVFTSGINDCLNTDINTDGQIDAGDITACTLCSEDAFAFKNCGGCDFDKNDEITQPEISQLASCTFVSRINECYNRDANGNGMLDASDISYCGLYCNINPTINPPVPANEDEQETGNYDSPTEGPIIPPRVAVDGSKYPNKYVKVDEKYASESKNMAPYKDQKEKAIAMTKKDFEVDTNEAGIKQPKTECNGCIVDSTCLPFGTRLVEDNLAKFCSIGEQLNEQNEKGANCQNNYECLSNQCIDGVCGSLSEELKETRGTMEKLFEWLKNIFG